jgi:hypothetical protein
MKTLWKIYYRLTLGKEKYEKILNSAKILSMNFKQSTKGGQNHFYNMNGEQIRGWHKRSITFKTEAQHPLIQRYQ